MTVRSYDRIPPPNRTALLRRHLAAGFVAPELLHACVAAATEAIVAVLQRVLFVVVLVIVLGGREVAGRGNGGGDLPVEPTAGVERRLAGLREALLLRCVREDLGAVLVTAIAELAARIQRV